MTPIYLFIMHSHSSGSKYFSRYLNVTFSLVQMHFEIIFPMMKLFMFSNTEGGETEPGL